MSDLNDAEYEALTAAMGSLQELALLLEGRPPSELGIDPKRRGASGEAERLRAAAQAVVHLRDLLRRDSGLPRHWLGRVRIGHSQGGDGDVTGQVWITSDSEEAAHQILADYMNHDSIGDWHLLELIDVTEGAPGVIAAWTR